MIDRARQHRQGAAADPGGARAALAEAATRQVAAPQVGQVAGHRRQRCQRALLVGRGRHQARRVGVARRAEERLCRRALDRVAGVHDDDAVAAVRRQAEVVRDEKCGHLAM